LQTVRRVHETRNLCTQSAPMRGLTQACSETAAEAEPPRPQRSAHERSHRGSDEHPTRGHLPIFRTGQEQRSQSLRTFHPAGWRSIQTRGRLSLGSFGEAARHQCFDGGKHEARPGPLSLQTLATVATDAVGRCERLTSLFFKSKFATRRPHRTDRVVASSGRPISKPSLPQPWAPRAAKRTDRGVHAV
jgi:hypothetical protein